jgi:DNA-binding NarL/FixJ family response regulator
VTRPRILLGDDHALILKGIQGLLEGRYEVVGSAENGRTLVEAALRLRPDLVILDVSMPVLNGIEAAREIKKALPAVKLIFLSMQTSRIYLRKALEAGASGYILKAGAAEELLAGIEEVRKGNLYLTPNFGPDVMESALEWCANGARSREKPAGALTDRQQRILQLLAEGLHNKEIAEKMHVSVRTVEFHRGRLMKRLGARNLAELTRLAIQEGMIDGAV